MYVYLLTVTQLQKIIRLQTKRRINLRKMMHVLKIMCIIADVSVFCAVMSLVLLKDVITTGDSNVCVAILPSVYSMKPSVTNFCLAREYCCEKHPPLGQWLLSLLPLVYPTSILDLYSVTCHLIHIIPSTTGL